MRAASIFEKVVVMTETMTSAFLTVIVEEKAESSVEVLHYQHTQSQILAVLKVL
jgi:hypothetical protein